jgi:hypothetical protein
MIPYKGAVYFREGCISKKCNGSRANKGSSSEKVQLRCSTYHKEPDMDIKGADVSTKKVPTNQIKSA